MLRGSPPKFALKIDGFGCTSNPMAVSSRRKQKLINFDSPRQMTNISIANATMRYENDNENHAGARPDDRAMRRLQKTFPSVIPPVPSRPRVRPAHLYRVYSGPIGYGNCATRRTKVGSDLSHFWCTGCHSDAF